MKARVLTGNKREIAEKVAQIEGDVREAIVFVDDPLAAVDSEAEFFAEMEPFVVKQPEVSDSRNDIYKRVDGE